MINKKRTWLYLNIFDGVYFCGFILSFLFFRDYVINIVVMWSVFFLCTGLALRRYCKGKPMIRFGTSSEIEDNDKREIISSYKYHLCALVTGGVFVVASVLKQFYMM